MTTVIPAFAHKELVSVNSVLVSGFAWRSSVLRSMFSSVQDGTHALGKAHNYALHLVCQFSKRSCWNGPDDVGLTDDGPFSSSASSFHACLLQVINGIMSLVLCLQVVSQAPQHFRSSETHTTWDVWLLFFHRQYICLVISSLYSGMFRAVHQQEEFWKVNVEHWHWCKYRSGMVAEGFSTWHSYTYVPYSRGSGFSPGSTRLQCCTSSSSRRARILDWTSSPPLWRRKAHWTRGLLPRSLKILRQLEIVEDSWRKL